MNTQLIFYTQVASIISFVIAVFVLYRILVKQKDATIELLKEKNVFLSEKLTEAQNQSPDVILDTLSKRITILTDEIERLNQDKEINPSKIEEKESLLQTVKRETEFLTKLLQFHDHLTMLSVSIEPIDRAYLKSLKTGRFTPDLYDITEVQIAWEVTKRLFVNKIQSYIQIENLVLSEPYSNKPDPYFEELKVLPNKIDRAFEKYQNGHSTSLLEIVDLMNQFSHRVKTTALNTNILLQKKFNELKVISDSHNNIA